jgi:hypothetical protein
MRLLAAAGIVLFVILWWPGLCSRKAAEAPNAAPKANISDCRFNDWRANFWADYQKRLIVNIPFDKLERSKTSAKLGGFPVELRYLKLKEGNLVLFQEEAGGAIAVRTGDERSPLTGETAMKIFEPITTDQQAVELAFLAESGRVIVCARQYQAIAEVCAKKAPNYILSKLEPSGEFGIKATSNDKGWLVEYAAFSLSAVYEKKVVVAKDGNFKPKHKLLLYGPTPPDEKMMKGVDCAQNHVGVQFQMCRMLKLNGEFQACVREILDGE